MARSFNGSSDKISLPSGFNPASIDFSIAVWIKPAANAGTNQRTILCSQGSAGFNFQLGTSSGSPSVLELDLTNTALVGQSSGTIADGSWAHAGLTFKQSTGVVTFYINGTVSGTGTNAENFTGQYEIGRNATLNSLFFSGSMADLFVYNGILSAGQFSGLSQGARPSQLFTNPANVLLNLPFDGLQSPEPDLSGLAHNGTLTGTALAAGPPVAPFTPRWHRFLGWTPALPAAGLGWIINRRNKLMVPKKRA